MCIFQLFFLRMINKSLFKKEKKKKEIYGCVI